MKNGTIDYDNGRYRSRDGKFGFARYLLISTEARMMKQRTQTIIVNGVMLVVLWWGVLSGMSAIIDGCDFLEYKLHPADPAIPLWLRILLFPFILPNLISEALAYYLFDIRLEFYQRVNYRHAVFMVIHLTLFFGIALFAAHRTRLWVERKTHKGA